MRTIYTPAFLRQFKRLDARVQEEVTQKIEEFKDTQNHPRLRVHKLHGTLRDRHSFSVNYIYRIVFVWVDKDTAAFLAVGDHSVYDE